MSQVFVFTAGISAARKHLDDSINTPIDFELVNKHIPEESKGRLLSANGLSRDLYCWGSTPGKNNIRNWELLQAGDIMLTVYEKAYRYASRVIYKIRSESLAESIWGRDPEGNTWEYMYFLTKPKKIEALLESIPIGSTPYTKYMGFTRISDERISQIERDWGSTDKFASHFFGIEKGGSQEVASISIENITFDAREFLDSETDLRLFKEKVLAVREGQSNFRRELLSRYKARCCITGCAVEAVLEAAHIIPYNGIESNIGSNGLVLRSDIHTLYDRDLISVSPEMQIHVSSRLRDSEYFHLHGKQIMLPSENNDLPSQEYLNIRHMRYLESNQ